MTHRFTPMGPVIAGLQTLAAALLLSSLAAAPAMAQEAEPDTWQILPHPASRAEVLAEWAAERANAKKPADQRDPRFTDLRPALTRAQVRAALALAMADGSYQRLHAEALPYEPRQGEPATMLAGH